MDRRVSVRQDEREFADLSVRGSCSFFVMDLSHMTVVEFTCIYKCDNTQLITYTYVYIHNPVLLAGNNVSVTIISLWESFVNGIIVTATSSPCYATQGHGSALG